MHRGLRNIMSKFTFSKLSVIICDIFLFLLIYWLCFLCVLITIYKLFVDETITKNIFECGYYVMKQTLNLISEGIVW